ncbi:ABC transporter permease subunit [Planosporangium thailandense]|uniref:ABC transporter permease subunit n=1 Tax=Planosporangium thailandense TaxID=765197 RepID=A0ABX0XZF1_9ACTN|nr:ABC transporter permease subunit [Planosporangium thailandense]NJC71428.1 ABC transporter permease subunit [Planosporangium thailandense]
MTVTVDPAAPVATAPARGGRRKLGAWKVPAGSVLLAAVAVLLWWVASTQIFVVPSPVATVAALVDSLSDDTYLVNLRSTAVAAVLALVLSVVLGVVIGLAFGLMPRLRRGFEPLVIATNGLPKIVMYPVLLLMVGMGTASKVSLAVLIGMFPVLMNVSASVRHMPPIYGRLARTLEATRWQVFWMVLLPAIRRALMTGIRLAVSLAMVGVVLAEMFATQYGLGRMILASYTSGQYPRMLATVLLLGIVSFAATTVLWRVERRMR